MKIVVDNQEIRETSSEKLLGLVINNTLTWKNHLYGDGENEGLLQQLTKRLGMLKMMSKQMKRENLKFFASVIFYSKLNYCLPVYGNVLGLENYKEENCRHQSFTSRDNQKLQVLQNNLNRMLVNARFDTPTEVLLKETNSLSVQQMIAYHTTLLAHKIVKTGKPTYLKQKLQVNNCRIHLREGQGSILQKKKKLSITQEGFVYRGATLLNKLSEGLRNEENSERFKVGLRRWVLANIPAKPVTKFTQFKKRQLLRNQTQQQRCGQQDIRRFCFDRSNTTQDTAGLSSDREVTPTDRPPPASSERGILKYFRPLVSSGSSVQPMEMRSDQSDKD